MKQHQGDEVGERGEDSASATTVPGGGSPTPSRTTAESEPDGERGRLARGAVIERFVILRTLGSGGAGVVYAAHDPDLDRTIALKLLHPEIARHQLAQARFLREAQALAKLSHPNVISIYDIGAYDDRAFIAMEFVDGVTFRQWMEQRTRSWREIVSMLTKAGRGLAAAHAAGLTHRDFKPDNVLVGSDGRVLVTDFGLARAATDDDEDLNPADLREHASGSVLSNTLTGTGLVLGTPAYMAPEQWLGEPTGPHTDQFSFCVTLYEALFGRRPYVKTAIDGTGPDPFSKVRPLPRGHGLPPWLVRAVLRGLEPEPAGRHPSMDAVLAHLSAGPRRARRVWLALAVTGAVALGGAAVYASAAGDDDLCGGARERLEGVWDVSSKLHMRAAFLGTDLPYAGDTWPRVQAVLDDYARRWVELRTGACEATHVHHTQSEALMDRQMACLAGRRRELVELVALLRQPTSTTIEHAVRAANALTPLEACADLEALAQGIAPPADREERAQVEAVRALLARAKVLGDAGSYTEALSLAERAADDAAKLDYLPIRAEAMQRLGDVQTDTGLWKDARASLTQAIWSAEASGHDEVAALALTDLVFALTELAELDEAAAVAARADAAVLRAGDPPLLRARLGTNEGALALGRGEYERAFEHFEEVLAITAAHEGERSSRAGTTLYNLGRVAGALGRADDALSYYRRSLAIEEETLGADHPSVAVTVHAIGRALSDRGQQEEALEHYLRALTILEPIGADTVLAGVLTDVGVTLRRQGRYEYAEEAQRRVLTLHARTVGKDHPNYGRALVNLGNVLFESGDEPEALETYRRGLEVLEAALGPDHPSLGRALAMLCGVHLHRDELNAALPYCERSYTLHERTLPPEHHIVVGSTVDLGKLHLARGELGEALPLLERGLSLQETTAAADNLLADTRFHLAKALWRTKGDRTRAKKLARQALDEFAAAGPDHAEQRAEVEAWLRRPR